MRKLLTLVLAAAFVAAPGCAQVDEDTYKKMGSGYGRSDGWFEDSNYDYYLMVNGTSQIKFESDGSALTLSDATNDMVITADTSDELQIGNGTEDISWGFGTSNTVIYTSDTGVVAMDLAAVGTTITLANDQTIVSDTDNEIQIGDNSEDISFGFSTSNTVDLSSDTGVVALDLAAVGTTITLANDQTIVSDTDNEIQIGDNSEDISFGFGTANTVIVTTDTGVNLMDFGALGTKGDVLAVTDTATLDQGDCGKVMMVTAGIDTKTITLPATIAGCVYTFMYTGADGGALLDISPNASDGIHGSCTLAASVLEFSGTDDADIGLTKATANTGDTITLAGDGSVGWFVTACAGIWANN